MRSVSIFVIAAGLTALLFALSARADAPATPATKPFVSEKQNYQCSYPADWRRINPEQIGGVELTLTPDADKIQTRFMVLYQPNDADGKQPDDKEVEQFLLNLVTSVADASIEKRADIELDHQPAKKVTISMKFRNQQRGPMTEEVVYCRQPHAFYFLMLASPAEKIADHEPGFSIVVESFRFTKNKR